jgi:hypothetical protein
MIAPMIEGKNSRGETAKAPENEDNAQSNGIFF